MEINTLHRFPIGALLRAFKRKIWKRFRKASRITTLSFISLKRIYGMIGMIGNPPFVR
jgi:hypothetical protein